MGWGAHWVPGTPVDAWMEEQGGCQEPQWVLGLGELESAGNGGAQWVPGTLVGAGMGSSRDADVSPGSAPR